MLPLLLLPLLLVSQDDEEGLEGLGVSDPTRAAREAAELALEDGRLADANRHAQRALESDLFDPELVLLALRTVGEDEDARLLYSHTWADATADAEGRAKLAEVANPPLAPEER